MCDFDRFIILYTAVAPAPRLATAESERRAAAELACIQDDVDTSATRTHQGPRPEHFITKSGFQQICPARASRQRWLENLQPLKCGPCPKLRNPACALRNEPHRAGGLGGDA